jgi:hypothetical protein
MAAGTSDEAVVVAYLAKMLAAESVALENSVVALGNSVVASKMGDTDPASVGESSAVL